MHRIRRALGTCLVAIILAMPLPSCAGPGGGPGLGPVASLALSIGASVGSYLLIQEITD